MTNTANTHDGFHISDHRLLWRRPRSYIAGEWFNRAGLQPLRCLYEHLRHRPNPRKVPEHLRALAEQLVEQGYVVIEDFLPDDLFAQVRAEFDLSTDTSNPEAKVTRKNGVRTVAGRFVEELAPVTAGHLLRNQDIWQLVSAALGIRMKYQPGAYFHSETLEDEGLIDQDHNIVLHKDVHYPTFKGFYLLNRNDPSNGSFVTVPGSHLLDSKRLRHEYHYSIDYARQRHGKSVSHPLHANGRMELHGPVYQREDLQEVQLSADANSLIIANTMGFHRRGGASHGKHREQVRMCFRHVETWHHRLYPALGMKNSRRFQERNYF